jgi:hypothetical protein
MMNKQEQVLLYGFLDMEKLEKIQKILHRLNIRTRVLPEEAWCQKVGYLLGMKGFKEAVFEDDGFVFPHEVMVMQNIRHKRLDQVLLALKEGGVPHIKFKSVVTPFNTLWTLRRLCETMQKEHAAMLEQEERAQSKE